MEQGDYGFIHLPGRPQDPKTWVPADLEAPGVGPPRSGGKIVLRGHPRRGERTRTAQGVSPPIQKTRVTPRINHPLPRGEADREGGKLNTHPPLPPLT